jgi:hypothetical protein
MFGFIRYLSDNTPDVQRLSFEQLAERLNTSIHHAHWQWQAEGRPDIVMLVSYANKLGQDDKLVAIDSRPIIMNNLGWPLAEPSAQGCEAIWDMVLDAPMDVDGFKVIAEYYDGGKLTANKLDSYCRYRLSTGSFFEYKIQSGQVSKVKD